MKNKLAKLGYSCTLSLLFSTVVVAQIDTILICEARDFVTLEARVGQFAYQWSPSANVSNPTIYNPSATPDSSTLYIAKMIPSLIGENLITNPDFSEGNVGFTSDYPFVESINTQGVYGVSESAKQLNNLFFTDCPDHTDGEGLMMVVDGSPVANEKVWCQSIEVQPNTSYAFSAWLTSVKVENPAELQFSINGTRIGRTFIAANQVCEWRQFFEVWEARTASEAEICIVNRNTNPQGNDFALDDFAFYEIEDIIYDSVQVIVSDLSIENIQVQSPDCGENNGKFEVIVDGALGKLSYTLDQQVPQSSPRFEGTKAGNYQLEVSDFFDTNNANFSCSITQDIQVSQKNCPVYIPNVFSPNGDQINDTFYLQTHPDFRGRLLAISIYDRWGNQVLRAQNLDIQSFQWDATFKASPLVSGIYAYVIQIEYEDGSTEQLIGEVNLVR
ncbi:MAG: gliding motility-associated C-terminal domain-containing protein [Bacteroidota bacterium]